MTVPEHELIWETTGGMLRDYRAGKLTEPTLVKLAIAGHGGVSGKVAWAALVKGDCRKADWFGGLAYVLGCHFHHNLGDTAFGAKLLRQAADAAPASSGVGKLVEERLMA